MLLHFESQAYLPPVTGAKTENMKQDLYQLSGWKAQNGNSLQRMDTNGENM